MEMTERIRGTRLVWRRGRAALAPAGLVFGLLLASGAATAQVAFLDPPRGEQERAQEVDVFVNGEFGGEFDAGGKFNRVNTGARYVTDGAVNRNFGLGVTLAYTYDGYDFDESSAAGCAPGAACFEVAPWKSIHTIDIAPSAGLILGPGIQILAWVPMRFSFEQVSNESSFTGGIIGGIRFVFAEGRIATTLGVGYQSEIEASGRVFGLIGVDWQLGERWRIVSEGGPYEGGLATILFGPSKQVKLRLSTGWERKRFRLSEESDRHASGVGEQQEVPVIAGVDIRLSKAFRLEFHGGVGVAGHMSIDDAGGNLLLESDYDVTGRVGGSMEVVF